MPDVKRRTTLRLVTAGLAGLAGCVTGDGTAPAGTDTVTPPESPPPEPTSTASPTPTSTGTPTSASDTPRIVDRSFRVTGRNCGTGEGGAQTTLDAPRIVVEGTATGSNGCATARLGEATYDADSDTLSVVVEVYRPTDAEACTQCLTDIDYRLSVRFEGGTPEHVRVAHDDTVIEESDVE